VAADLTRQRARLAGGIRAVFFDHGHTLAEPLGGSWWPGHRFDELTRAHGLEIARDARFDAALARGYAYLDANHAVANLEEEDAQFAEYYRIVLRELGVSAPPALIAQLSHAYVRELNFAPYDDTRGTLERLRGMGLALAVVSDSWPSVEAKYERLGLRGFFAAFVISSRERCIKPDPRMFTPALLATGVRPEEALFVDDGVDLVESVREQGFHGLVMDRAGAHPRHPGFVRRLDEIVELLAR
jgi:HAD superfamily hydrolase (TIGR01509 family)